MSLRNPLARARGHGSAQEGVHHWWMQRLSAMALLLLLPWFAVFAIGLIGADYLTVRLSIAQPLNATLLLLLTGAMFYHARLGLQVVIEDYVGTRWLEVTLHVLTRFAYLVAAVAAIFAIVRIALSAG
jgi:succinate dehydrogenase / fumarate reductase, membrane anchor subunit